MGAAPCGRAPPGVECAAHWLRAANAALPGTLGSWYKTRLFSRPRIHTEPACEEFDMSRVCQITGKRPMTGNTVSHANNKRRRRFLPNLHTQRFWVESERRFVSLRVSTRGLRTIEKKGIEKVVADLRAKGVEV